MKYKELPSPQKWIIKGIPILFTLGSFMHFLYYFSGDNPVVGIISAVNESVWEHLKMVLLPVVCWWTGYYTAVGKKKHIDKNKWFTGALTALLAALAAIPMLYYFYTEAFGVEVLAVDIGILFLAVLFGQILGLHFYRYSEGINSNISLCIFIAIILLFAVFTFNPPHFPIFRDSITGEYGINLLKF